MQNEETLEQNSVENPKNDSNFELNPTISENKEAPEVKGQDKKRLAKKERLSAQMEGFFKEIQEIPEVEAKIEFAIAFMEKAIAQENTADFKSFWEARMKCLSLFKENVPPFLRHQLWNKFSELSKEARRLKDMLDEQSEFAAEQIDIAIQAIEKGLDDLPETLEREEKIELPSYARALKDHFGLYNQAQRELVHLNLFASRITSLRKELIKTEMRVKVKNKFFERMSKTGDRVFPRRKMLIQQISQTFSEDVNQFIKDCFSSDSHPTSLFDLREEIKALQAAAKFFTLNTQSFSQTRLLLSSCWDKLKEKDKEKKLEFDKKREIFKKNLEELMAKVQGFLAKFEKDELNPVQAFGFLEDILKEMRERDLGRDELKALRQSISDFKDKINAKQKLQDEERQRSEDLRMKQKKELFENYRSQCLEFINKAKELSAEDILLEKEKILAEIQQSTLSKLEKNELEKTLKMLKDILREKREQALLLLPDDERQALGQLKELLNQKREHRQEIKDRIEQFRKLLGASGLSFEKSMDYNARVAEEKENYEKAQNAVHEIENKIEALESKLS